MEKILCPSMMCVDYSCLKDEVQALNEAGIDIFHCDIMDGSFVPNITMGTLDIKAIKANTDLMVDAHLMIENPRTKVDIFIEAGADLIYIHPESERYTIKTLDYIKAKGKIPGLVINPDTAVCSIKELLPHAEYVMVMSVNPGYSGQAFIESMVDKIKELVALKPQYGYKLIIDGAISPEKVASLSKLGADGFILGSKTLFGFTKSYKELIAELRSL